MFSKLIKTLNSILNNNNNNKHDSLGFLLPFLQRHCLFPGFFKKPPTPGNHNIKKKTIRQSIAANGGEINAS